MRLKLVDAAPPVSEGFDVPDRDLRRLPTRPGVSQERLSLHLPPAVAAEAADAARAEGLREDAWIGLVIESERALRLAATSDDHAELLRTYLDETAARPLPSVPGDSVRARSFAAALRNLCRHEDVGVRRLAPRDQASTLVSVMVPAHAVVAWRRGAIAARLTLGEWATKHLRKAPQGRTLWEAGAVEAGETLAEWVLSQDARRRSTR